MSFAWEWQRNDPAMLLALQPQIYAAGLDGIGVIYSFKQGGAVCSSKGICTESWNITGWKSAETVFQDDYSAVAEGDGHTTNLLYDRVENLFHDDIVARYQELRSSVLSADNINSEFEKFMSPIPPYLYAEDYASTTGGGNFTDIPLKTTNNILQIRQFVIDRLEYVDSQILE